MSKRSATDGFPSTTKLRRPIDDNNQYQFNASTSSGYSVGKRLCDTDDDTIPQKQPNIYLASGLKRSLHGTIYQLKLLMVFIVRGLKNNYKFRLATEIDAAESFDDLVFQYQSGDVIASRFLQAKHKQDESKSISFSDLSTNVMTISVYKNISCLIYESKPMWNLMAI